jgi:hypothetical protein
MVGIQDGVEEEHHQIYLELEMVVAAVELIQVDLSSLQQQVQIILEAVEGVVNIQLHK